MYLVKITKTLEANGHKAAEDDTSIFPRREFKEQLDAMDFLIEVYAPGGFNSDSGRFALSLTHVLPSTDAVQLVVYYTNELTDHITQMFKKLEAGQTNLLMEAATSLSQ